MQRHENKKPLPDRSPEGTKWGVGARPALFPDAIIWHQPKQVDCSPTLFSVTCGVVGLIAGPFKVLRRMNFRVRFICPLSQWLRPLTCGPGWDTPVLHSHPSPLAAGRPSLVTMRWPVPRVSPLNPQVAIRSLGSATVFVSPPVWIVFTAVVLSSWLSRREPQLCPSFQRISPG